MTLPRAVVMASWQITGRCHYCGHPRTEGVRLCTQCYAPNDGQTGGRLLWPPRKAEHVTEPEVSE